MNENIVIKLPIFIRISSQKLEYSIWCSTDRILILICLFNKNKRVFSKDPYKPFVKVLQIVSKLLMYYVFLREF